MNQRSVKGWFKNLGFIILDMICLQVAFLLAYVLMHGWGNPYAISNFRHLILMLTAGQVLTFFLADTYRDIHRRGYLEELYSVLRFAAAMLVVALLLLFAFHTTYIVSRLLTGWTMVGYVVLDYLARILNKRRIAHGSRKGSGRSGHSLVVIAPGRRIDEVVSRLMTPGMSRDCFVKDCLDADAMTDAEIIEKLRTSWVDDVFLLQGEGGRTCRELMETLVDMGITVHLCTDLLSDDIWAGAELERMGQYTVLSRSIRSISFGETIVKRLADILGGFLGCIITAVLFVFVAPWILVASPGSVFFTQMRIGRGGKPFKMYKFRSMYPDAEKRKAALLEQNKSADGLTFKMDRDPRIIRGVGTFIRRTSMDEFPQFWNVLKGDMSLVGTRPPLPEEWEKYDIHHRARMTMKPGITGMWQVNGRSDITDFETIVRLDREYIENWSLKLDFKILLKTVLVVFSGKGAR